MSVYVFGWLSLGMELEVKRGLTVYFHPDIKKTIVIGYPGGKASLSIITPAR